MGKLKVYELAKEFINEEKEIKTAEDAINGALDIIAENISDNSTYRQKIKKLCYQEGIIVTKATKEEKSAYDMYYEIGRAHV